MAMAHPHTNGSSSSPFPSTSSLALPPSSPPSSASASRKGSQEHKRAPTAPRSSSLCATTKPLPAAPIPTHVDSSQSQSPSSAPSSTQFRASTGSVATSNSSLQPPLNPSPLNGNGVFSSPSLNASAVSDMDHTANLIRKLYARLEERGVPGDGWDEGRERSRDGIISREEAEGVNTIGRGGRGLAELSSPSAGDRNSTFVGVLPPQEEQILKRVDRYGFFSSSHPAALSCQHNRLATLTAAPYLLLPSANRKPPISTPSSPPSSSNHSENGQYKLQHRVSTLSLLPSLSPEDMALEVKRIDKWAAMLVVTERDTGGNVKDWDLSPAWWSGRTTGEGKYRRFQRRVFKGVPDRWRRAVWGLEMEKMASEVQGRGLPSLDALKQEYENLIAQPSSQDIQIDLDVPRTISGHVQFHTRYGQGQRALFHVLHAFGLRSEDIGGYCQGMGPIAATLLCYFEPERAYASLVRLFYQYNLRDIFAPGFPGLLEAFYVQERLVELLMPDVHQAFLEHGISTSSYATKWYITLFANSIPFSTQLRFWDCLLLEGVDFLVIASLSIIWCFKDDFTKANTSFETILSTLSSYFLVDSDDALLRWIRKTMRRSDLRKKMVQWHADWKGFVVDGTASSLVT